MANIPQQSTKWDSRELHVLVSAKKYLQDQSLLDSSRERMRTAESRWKEVETICRTSNVNREWKQCKKRWEKLLTDFKKIFDYQRNTPTGTNGYFQLSRPDKKDRALPATFQEDLFQSMVLFVPSNRAVNPHPDQYVDSAIEDESRTPSIPNTVSPIDEDVIEQRNDTNVEYHYADSVFDATHTTQTQPPVNTNETPIVGEASPGVVNRESQRASNVPQPSHISATAQREGDPSDRTTIGWKRTRGERTATELQKITTTFVSAISDDRNARREEHREHLTFEEKKLGESLENQREAITSARETGRDVANALSFIGDSIRYLADGFNRT